MRLPLFQRWPTDAGQRWMPHPTGFICLARASEGQVTLRLPRPPGGRGCASIRSVPLPKSACCAWVRPGARETGAGHHHLSGSLSGVGSSRRTRNMRGWRLPPSGEPSNASTSRAQSIHCRPALGAAYRARKDPLSLERAAAQYELVLRHAPDHLPAMTGLAAVLRDLGELSQARALYERVLAVAPQDTSCPERPGRRVARSGGCAGR